MTQPYQFKVELHRFAKLSRDTLEPLDLTPFVKSIDISLSTAGPWEQASLVLEAPRPRQYLRVLTEAFRGGWLVITDRKYGLGTGTDAAARHESSHRERAIFWGYVSSRRGSLRVDERGALHTGAIPMTALGWFDFLGRVRVQKAPGVVNSTGTLIGPKDWKNLFDALAATSMGTEDIDGSGREFRRRDIGESLKPLLEVVGRVLLPPTLGGREKIKSEVSAALTTVDLTRERVSSRGTVTRSRLGSLGDKISVVHDAATRDRHAPNVVVDPVPGWTIRGIQSFAMNQSTAQQLILGTFSGDPNMIELYPTLEDPALFRPKEKALPAAPQDLSVRTQATTQGDVTFGALRRKEPGPETTGPKPESEKHRLATPQFANETAKALGANPALVYRMKPWRTEELSEHVGHKDVLARQLKPGDLDSSIFRGVTWRANDGAIRSYLARDIFQVEFGRDDADHVNCVTVGLPTQPDSDIRWLERAGLPLIRRHSNSFVWRNGLRVYEPQWPFWPTFDSKDKSSTDALIGGLRTVAAQAAQFMGFADRFLTGSISMRYDGTIRPGQFIDVAIPGAGTGVRLSAYVDAVSHRIWVEAQGQVMARTNVQYSRGLMGEGMDRDQQYDLGDEDAANADQSGSSQ
jgi:hypothetical protein